MAKQHPAKQVQLDLRATRLQPRAKHSRVAALLQSPSGSPFLASKATPRGQTGPGLTRCPPLPSSLGPVLHTQLGLHLHQEGGVKRPMTQDRTDTLTDLPRPQPAGSSPPLSHSPLHHTAGPPQQVNPSSHQHLPVPRSSKNQAGRGASPLSAEQCTPGSTRSQSPAQDPPP